MEKFIDIAVLVGSLRKASLNRMIANVLIALASSPLKLEIVEIGHLPLYNQDSEDVGCWRTTLREECLDWKTGSSSVCRPPPSAPVLARSTSFSTGCIQTPRARSRSSEEQEDEAEQHGRLALIQRRR